MQAAWILALPPFRGIDEFDHAFRAAAVADGQWLPSYEVAPQGRGDLIEVPTSIVRAAQPVCESYEYTGRDNCHPVRTVSADTVLVASAAGRYHPVFYWVIGAPASFFEGATALYAMRLASAALCATLIALAGYCISLWARTKWPYVGLFAALSPVAVYSTAVAAPNGIEIVAGLSLWASLIGLANEHADSRMRIRLLLVSIPALLVLTTVRPLGPAMTALILATVLILLGLQGARRTFKEHPRLVCLLGALATLAVSANFWWVKSTSAMYVAFEDTQWATTNPLTASFAKLPVWTLQTIAAFPVRNEPAPTFVYAAWLTFLPILLITATRLRTGNTQHALVVSSAIAILLPVALSIMTIQQTGPIWQGRYGLAYTVGVPLLAGFALDRDNFRHRLAPGTVALGWLTLVAAHAVSAQNVLISESVESPLADDPSWIFIHPWAPAALMVAGGLISAYSLGIGVQTPPAADRNTAEEPGLEKVVTRDG